MRKFIAGLEPGLTFRSIHKGLLLLISNLVVRSDGMLKYHHNNPPINKSRMKSFAIVLLPLLAILLTSCGNSQETFPTNINVSKTENLKRIKGTKLFVDVPDTYKPLEKLVRLQKDDRTYL